MLRASRPRVASPPTAAVRRGLTVAVLAVSVSAAAARAQTDYLDLRERLESARATLRAGIAPYLRPPDQEAFPTDKPGKAFRTYLEAALAAVNAKQDFPAVHAALAKWNGRIDAQNETQRRALGLMLGDYMTVRYGDDLIRELRTLVQFKTYHNVISENADNVEFQLALRSLQTLAEGLGLDTALHQYETLEIRLGAAKANASAPPVVMFAHIEVMRPVEYKWDTDKPPFTLTLQDGRWVGCGVYADKGPLLVNLFALRTLRDANVALARPLVLLVGTQMSTPGAGVASSLATLATPPALVLAADGCFPYSEGQMGNLVARVASHRGMKSIAGLEPATFYIYKMSSYYSMNTLPAEARIWVLYRDPVDSTNPSLDMVNKWRGIIEPHQAANPETRYGTYVQQDTLHFFSYTLPAHVESGGGRNAIFDAAAALAKVPMYRNSAWDIIRFLDAALQSDASGRAAGLHYEDAKMGSTRIHPVQFDRIGEEVAVLVDVRFPVGHDRAWMRSRFEELVAKFNREHDAALTLTWEGAGREPLQQSPPPGVAAWLRDAYELGSGDIGAEPAGISRSAGTLMPPAIPFGPERTGADKHGHTQHESISARELSDLALSYVAALAWFGGVAAMP